MVLINAETRSFKRASTALDRLVGLKVSTNTIERVCLDVGGDLEAAERDGWQEVLTGEVVVPEVAIVEFDGGRIRTRKTGHGPGVHLESKGWNETKNAIFVSATSQVSLEDPEPEPPACFLDPGHVAKLTEKAKVKEKAGADDSFPEENEGDSEEVLAKSKRPAHKPRRILRTLISSMKNVEEFGRQMRREANRRQFDSASRKAFVADGLTCNWGIHAEHFADYVPILDFTHAVSYLFTASIACLGKSDTAWEAYARWMRLAWQGLVGEVIRELEAHQQRMGLPEEGVGEEDPREQLRRVLGYLRNNQPRMAYATYRKQGLPTTSAWMESAVKEINYRVKGTEMFWNNPEGAEAILQIRAAALCDDDRLVRLLTGRPGRPTQREPNPLNQAA